MRHLPALALTATLATVATEAAAEEAGDWRRGLELARHVCANCHAVEEAVTDSPLTRAPAFDTVANTPGMTGLALTVFLRTPHRNMPDLILTPAEISDVVAYILSLDTGG